MSFVLFRCYVNRYINKENSVEVSLLSGLFCFFKRKHMAEQTQRVWTPPPTIESLYAATDGNQFSSINRPTAGARTVTPLPDGKESLQLYSLATPNGQKVGILLEELGVPYDAHFISIMQGDQFGSGFVQVNPNSKIPSLTDKDGPGHEPIHLFESGAICLYLAQKFGKFLPSSERDVALMHCWIQWQMSAQGPMSGNFGHFFVYAPAGEVEARNYGVARYGMEVQRLCSVLNNHLENRQYIVGNEYTIADMIIFPWFQQIRTGYIHKSGIGANQFLNASQYQHVCRWADHLLERPAVQRGLKVCSTRPNL
jgi:GSH-dependent disulfide-bond oxidoreductase